VGIGGCTTERSEIVRDLLSYLIDNPDAQDTLEGIVEWWLLERKIENRTAKVREALTELVASGLILEREGSDSRPRYLINTRKQEEIRKLLERRSE
jgi:predicted transcriptional regulator